MNITGTLCSLFSLFKNNFWDHLSVCVCLVLVVVRSLCVPTNIFSPFSAVRIATKESKWLVLLRTLFTYDVIYLYRIILMIFFYKNDLNRQRCDC
jgi:hypothetical protein